MPNRVLKETWVQSETIDALSAEGERLAARLLDYLDDYGWGKANPRLVLSACFPLKVEVLKAADVGRWIDELVKVGLVELWDNHGTLWMHWIKWREHVKPRADKSKCPLEYDRNGATRVRTCAGVPAPADTCTHVQTSADTCTHVKTDSPDNVSVPVPGNVPDNDPETTSAAAAAGGGGEATSTGSRPEAPALVLTSMSTRSSTRSRRDRAKAPPNPDVKRLIDHYHAEFVRTQKAAPVILGARAGTAAKLLLSGRTFEAAAAIVTRILEDPPEWEKSKGLLRLEDFPAIATKVLARASPGTRRAADGMPVSKLRERIVDTIDTDEEGQRRRVRIFEDPATGKELRRTWGRATEAQHGQ